MVPDYSRTKTAEVHMFLLCRFHDYECSSPNALVEPWISESRDSLHALAEKRPY